MAEFDSICFGLLAGGQSSRMGHDKASLNWNGQPLWKHQLRLAAEIDAREILISGKLDGPYRGAAKIVSDELSNRGPIAGIAALLGAMQSEWLVPVGVDMPFLDAATLRRVLELRGENCGVVPAVKGRAHALAGVYPRGALPLARKHLLSDDRSLRTFANAAAAAGLVRLVDWETEDVFRSLNTPEEWSAAKSA